jgi:hypothetical protein
MTDSEKLSPNGQRAVELFKVQLAALGSVRYLHGITPEFAKWKDSTNALFMKYLPTSPHFIRFSNIRFGAARRRSFSGRGGHRHKRCKHIMSGVAMPQSIASRAQLRTSSGLMWSYPRSRSTKLHPDRSRNMKLLRNRSQSMRLLRNQPRNTRLHPDHSHNMKLHHDRSHNMKLLRDSSHNMKLLRDSSHNMKLLRDSSHSMKLRRNQSRNNMKRLQSHSHSNTKRLQGHSRNNTKRLRGHSLNNMKLHHDSRANLRKNRSSNKGGANSHLRTNSCVRAFTLSLKSSQIRLRYCGSSKMRRGAPRASPGFLQLAARIQSESRFLLM